MLIFRYRSRARIITLYIDLRELAYIYKLFFRGQRRIIHNIPKVGQFLIYYIYNTMYEILLSRDTNGTSSSELREYMYTYSFPFAFFQRKKPVATERAQVFIIYL